MLTLLLLLQPKAEQNEPPCLAYAMLIARLTFDTQRLGALRCIFKKWRPMENSAVNCLPLIVFAATVRRIKLSDVKPRHCSRQNLVPPAVNVSVDRGVFTFCTSGFTYPCVGRDKLSVVQDAPVVGMAFHAACGGNPGLKKLPGSAPSRSTCLASGTAVVADRSDSASSGAVRTSSQTQAGC